MNISTVRRIMEEVRCWAEEIQPQMNRDYGYHLAGMCAICSYLIYKRLRRAGYRPIFCLAYGHAFLELEGYILDVTATQFLRRNGQPWERVVIIPKNSQDAEESGYYYIWKQYKSIRGIKKELSDWGIQSPYHPEIQKRILLHIVHSS